MANLEVGQEIGKYVLTDFIGRGGMGEVWKAQHSRLSNRTVAIKVLLPEHQLLGESAARFMREAEVLDGLGDHPHIVSIYDLDEHDGRDYIVMSYLPNTLAQLLGETEREDDGGTVGASVQRSLVLSIEEAVRLGREICNGLSFAHVHGVIHRDLKPSNVLLSEEGVVQLCDFGIAHVMGGTGLTGTSMGMGTVGYTAMEILEGHAREATAQSDIYSVGAILYRMVTGRAPLGRYRDPVDHNADVPAWLNDCILKCLEEEPALRYETAEKVLESLKPLSEEEPVSRYENTEEPSKVLNTSPEEDVPSFKWEEFANAPDFQDVFSNLDTLFGGVSIPEDLRTYWEAHEARLKGMGFDIPFGQELVIRNEKDDGIALWIPDGEFVMGSDDGDSNEKPIHRVVLDGYYLDMYPITVGQYQKYVKETGVKMPTEPKWGWEPDHPIVNVSWQDAKKYCDWSGKELPSEAQWEYGARGVDGRKYPWGNEEPSPELCNYGRNVDKTTPVGSYASGMSAFGLHDMSGNVWEWCMDWYDEEYYGKSLAKNPVNDKESGAKSLRGGSWCYILDGVRCAYRDGNYLDYWNNFFGFRCVRQK